MIWKLVLLNVFGHLVPHARNKLLESFSVAEYLVISGLVGLIFGVSYMLYAGHTIGGMMYKITTSHLAMISYNNLIAIIQSLTLYGLMATETQTGGSMTGITILLTSLSMIMTYVIGLITGQEQLQFLKLFSVFLIGTGTYLFS